jgi:hypothetical protein
MIIKLNIMKNCNINPIIMSPPLGLDISLFSFFYHNAASNEANKSTVGTKLW